jgi:Mn-dependent DtxR family transcriptional regulator
MWNAAPPARVRPFKKENAMHHDSGLSPTHEMYLKVLYRLQEDNDVGRVRDMAKGLGVTPSTVSAVLKKLEQVALLVHDHYGTIKLTPAGLRVAECIVRRFEILRALLVDVLGLDVESAELDACAMEHVVSPATVNRMESLLQLVRDGKIGIEPLGRAPLVTTVCTSCEAMGTCQAVASIEGLSARADRN